MHGPGIFLLIHALVGFGQIVQGSVIIHGRKAPENSLKYMVSVQNHQGHICGGFLISDKFVVTAAHCLKYEPDHVLLGHHDLKSSKIKRLNLTYACKNPAYMDVSKGDDIMLLKLAEKVPQDNGIKTIPIPASGTNLRNNQTCSVAGWGITETSRGHVVHNLREANVSIFNPSRCDKLWGHILPPNVICAGGTAKEGFCQGDSGGPLVCNGIAVGVVSFNKAANCVYPDVPNVYTDISANLGWINGVMNEDRCFQ